MFDSESKFYARDFNFFKYLRSVNTLRFSGLGKSKTLGDYAEKLKEFSAEGLLSSLNNDDIAFVKAIGKYVIRLYMLML